MKKNSRSLKNIIMIIVLVLMLGASVFTIYFARKDTSNNGDSSMNRQIQDNRMNQPPSGMPGDSTNGNENQMPPNEKSDKADDTDDESDSKESSSNEKTANQVIDQKQNDNGMNNMPQERNDGMPNQGMDNFDNRKMSKGIKVSGIYPMLFCIESLVSALIIMYLVMSKFNKYSFKDTLENTDKIIIFIFGTIILTTIITKVLNIISII